MGLRRELDVNRERLLFVCMSLVGRKVTAKLRNSIIYEGLFHSCCLDGDQSITLRCARQTSPMEQGRVAEAIGTLVIPGKDFLQISAMDVPPLPTTAHEASGPGTGFVTDGQISQKSRWVAASHDRELVPWAGGGAEGGAGPAAAGGALEDGRGSRNWDQFEANESMFGVQTTFNEELYTTKLDPQKIPREKREEAERIAREIEAGPTNSAMEEKLEAPDDEEATFSAVTRGAASSSRGGGRDLAVVGNGGSAFAQGPKGATGSQRLGSAAPQSETGQMALTKEHLSQHDSWAGSGLAGDGFALEHRTKRGMITAHSPIRPPMVSEMKRINALNLEPALPKLDDKMRNAWINFKQSQNRKDSKSASGSGLKMEFEQSLQVIQQRQLSKQQDQPPERTQQQAQDGGSALQSLGPAAANDAACSSTAGAGGAMLPRRSSGSNPAAGNPSRATADTGGDTSRSSKFTFNPGAKEFSFNPQAATFTPNVGSSPSGGGGGAASPQARAQGASPQFHAASHDARCRPLWEILGRLLDQARHERCELVNPEWTEAVGLAFREVLGRPQTNGPPALVTPAGAAPGAGPGSWQQQAAASGASAGSQSQPGQVYPQMYAAPGSGGVSGQRSPGGGGQGGMIAPQGGQMGPGSKFGGQVGIPVMVPSGQYGQQGFVPQGQPGPGAGQSGQVMMNPGGAMIMQPMYSPEQPPF